MQAESVADSHTTFETTGKNIIDLDDSFVSDDKVASGVIQDEDIQFLMKEVIKIEMMKNQERQQYYLQVKIL